MTQGERPDLFEVLDIAVAETGARDHRIRRANAAACAVLGRPETEVIGLAWEDIAVPEDKERWAAQARLRLATGQPRTRMMLRLLRPDGSVVHALSTIVLRTGPDGEQYFLSTLQDVSEEIAAHNRLRLVVENTPVSIFLADRDGRVLVSEGTASPQAAAGLSEARQSSIFQTFADLPQAISIMHRALDGERVNEIIFAFGRWLDVHLVPIPGSGGEVGSVAAVITDITERQQALASLRVRSAEQAVIADLGQRALEAESPAALWERAVTALADHLGADFVQAHDVGEHGARGGLLARVDRRVPPEPPLADPIGLTVPVGRANQVLATIEIQRPPGAEAFTDQEVRFLHSVAAVLGSAAIRFRMESEIRHRSLHDGLTGLPNRTALLDHLDRALRRARHDDRRVGVLFIDLDGFKAVNDTLGHQAGDEVLRATAGRLGQAVRPGDVVGRLAGDEFAVLCEDVASSADLAAIADRVLAALAVPSLLRERPIVLTGSVGLALSGPEPDDGEELLNAADIAMYVAKRAGPGRRIAYDRSMRTRLTNRLAHPDELRRILDGNDLIMLRLTAVSALLHAGHC
ncbi:diguanylate cyclase [Frankia sp. AiPs1]|uniref:diguanylate cyclase domain-containing protein n=1 Tax=Frankia sp. AiPs1 TaxID=573493 RepID=UPI00204435AC|nr:diguanylate cyclase [Frankia sp. AiPs1]MCM3922731.1 diguanylate cyclase [Frankia sp. AiPs1]